MMTRYALPGGFIVSADELHGRFELDHPDANISYRIQDPRGFHSEDAWIDYVERTANAQPGTFYSTLKGDYFNGKHRTATAALYGRATSGARFSTGRPGAAVSARAIFDAHRAGEISSAEAAACIKSMTVPGSGIYDQQSAIAHAHYKAQYLQQQAMLASYRGWSPSMPPHEPTKLKSDGMKAGEIIAWRAWNISGDNLASVVADGKVWSATGPMQGDPAAGYGVHAYKGPHGPLLDSYVKKGSDDLWVIGEVALWGDVIEHEDGYRAEFARVHSLVTWHDAVKTDQRKQISDKYLTARPAFKLDDAA